MHLPIHQGTMRRAKGDLMLTISHTIRRTQTTDGAVLLDIERGQMFCLNPVGSQILELLDAGNDERQIAEQMSAAYGVDLDMVRTDVGDFIESLSRHRMLERQEPATKGK